jgi:hypothetical protein
MDNRWPYEDDNELDDEDDRYDQASPQRLPGQRIDSSSLSPVRETIKKFTFNDVYTNNLNPLEMKLTRK